MDRVTTTTRPTMVESANTKDPCPLRPKKKKKDPCPSSMAKQIDLVKQDSDKKLETKEHTLSLIFLVQQPDITTHNSIFRFTYDMRSGNKDPSC